MRKCALQLRQYQTNCLDAIKKSFSEGDRRLIVSLPTGAGKTVIFSQLISDLKCRALVLAHTNELLQQSKSKIEMITGRHVGLIDQFHKEFDSEIVVSSIQSAMIPSNLKKLAAQNFPLCIYDESHRAASDGARKVLAALGFVKNTHKLLCGFTATPFRHDNRKGLAEVFDKVAYDIDIQELISQGYLVPPVGYMIATDLDLSHIPTVDGDFKRASLASVMDCDDMTDAIVNAYKEKAAGRKTICFCVSVDHARHVADSFNRHGIKAALMHGNMDKKLRDRCLKQYEKGNLTLLCNAQLLTEGIDLPETSCIIMSPTKSRLKFQQACGRGLRPAPWINKKDCIILNFGDRDHKICSVATLLPDATLQPQGQSNRIIAGDLPVDLNPRLKAAIASFNPLGQSFSWSHMEDGRYAMKGNGNRLLEVIHQYGESWKVVYTEENNAREIASDLGFEYAFGTAEEFAQQHRNLFIIHDLNASWRELPISEKQKEIIQSHGFKKGIEELTRGQASILISSGALGGRSGR